MKKDSATPRPDDGTVWADLSDPNRGRADRSRLGRRHPRDPQEFGSPVTQADIDATLELLKQSKRRRRKTG